MQIAPSVRSVVASVSLVGLGMLASPWRTAVPQDPRNLDARLRALETVLTPQNGVLLMKLLPHMSMVELDNGDGTTSTTMLFSGVNVQIVNGLGATNGNEANPTSLTPDGTSVNGLGNLIVGYNELGNPTVDDRTGSHNLIVGRANTFTSYGSLVTGWQNTSGGVYSSVTAGNMNMANADFSVINGGLSNTTSNVASVIIGGRGNIASGFGATVVGGRDNLASGGSATVTGGRFNVAQGPRSLVAGGESNLATGGTSSVTGGSLNTAVGLSSNVSGGASRTASGDDDWVAGTLFEDN